MVVAPQSGSIEEMVVAREEARDVLDRHREALNPDFVYVLDKYLSMNPSSFK
jgi:hypothetical protein